MQRGSGIDKLRVTPPLKLWRGKPAHRRATLCCSGGTQKKSNFEVNGGSDGGGARIPSNENKNICLPPEVGIMRGSKTARCFQNNVNVKALLKFMVDATVCVEREIRI